MSRSTSRAVLLAIFALFNVAYGDLSGDEDTAELTHKDAYVYVQPKNIDPGCARFYISDPIGAEDGTKYWQVCSAPLRDKSAKVAIGSGVFSKIKDRYGAESANSISFISTGPDCWVTIYAESGGKGDFYEITPLRDVDLSFVGAEDNPSQTTFNDNILSGEIRSSNSGDENPDGMLTPLNAVPIAVWYRFVGAPRVKPDDGCGYFYQSDPTIGDANGFAVCISQDQHLAHVSLKDMRDRKLVLRGKQPFINGTISEFQDPNGGPQSETGEEIELMKVEPWEGDVAHSEAADIKWGRKKMMKRRLRSLQESEGTEQPGFFDGFNSFFEGVVEAVDTLIQETVQVFTGATVALNVTLLPTMEPTMEPTTAQTMRPTTAAVKFSRWDRTGIKYVEAGPNLDVALWTNDNFSGIQELIKSGTAKLIVGKVTNSFFLISSKYQQERVHHAEDAVAAKKEMTFIAKAGGDLHRKAWHEHKK